MKKELSRRDMEAVGAYVENCRRILVMTTKAVRSGDVVQAQVCADRLKIYARDLSDALEKAASGSLTITEDDGKKKKRP